MYEPLLILGQDKFAGVDIHLRCKGGGFTSQVYALRQAIAKCIVAYYQKCESPLSHGCHVLCALSGKGTRMRRCVPCVHPPVRMPSVLCACAASGVHTFLRIWLRVFLAAHRRGRAVQEADQGDAHAVRPHPAGALPPCAIALCAVRLCGAARRLLRLPAPYVSPCRRAVPSARLRRSVCCVACTLGDNSSDQCSVCCLCYQVADPRRREPKKFGGPGPARGTRSGGVL